nr:helix-turn-helix transcriptional regulator [uncultured Blautia sp.]
MGLYYIGEVIKRTRESLGMTQEELSEGICTTETLSRIETGKRTPNRANFKALMERMGRCGEKYFPHIRVESYKKMEQ